MRLDAALASLPRGKRPGSDGLPYEFYMSFWAVVGPPLLHVFSEAFSVQHEKPCLPESMRIGSIVLLYKDSRDRALVHNYRPISLLNADYMVFAKALALRFGTHLASVVGETQTAFLPGR